MPAVSILMPSYNHARFLPSTVQSLLNQTFENWELIAVDDGSTDESVSLLSSIADPRLKVFVNERNLGTYGTLAKALTLSEGSLIAVLDSDDEWSPNKLELQIDLLTRHPEVEACYTAGRSFGEGRQSSDVHGDWPTDEVQELLPRLLEENRVLASSVIFRRSVAGFEPSLRYSGDWEALLRACARSPIGYVAEPVTGWRLHEHNSFVRSKEQVSEEIRLRQSILAAQNLWQQKLISREEIRTGLSRCALHLSALLVLEGRMAEARTAARFAFKHGRSVTTFKRLAVVNLARRTAQNQLWPGTLPWEASVPSALLDFAR